MNGRLLITCHDRHGIVAAVAGFLAASGANIISSDQHSTDPEGGEFFMRMEFNLEQGDLASLGRAFQQEVAAQFDMRWRLADGAAPKRMAVLVSKEDHCLVDLLWRHRRGELDATISLVASNHPDWANDVAGFGLSYHHVPFPNEPELIALLQDQCDLVVLARYMRILSGEFLSAVGVPIINIHHSFLPAFAGANPYQRAFERELHPHEELPALGVGGVLVGGDDVRPGIGEEPGDGGDDPVTIGTGDEQATVHANAEATSTSASHASSACGWRPPSGRIA